MGMMIPRGEVNFKPMKRGRDDDSHSNTCSLSVGMYECWGAGRWIDMDWSSRNN